MIVEVRLSGSEPTIIKRSALVQQLSVRKDPGPNFAASSKAKLNSYKPTFKLFINLINPEH